MKLKTDFYFILPTTHYHNTLIMDTLPFELKELVYDHTLFDRCISRLDDLCGYEICRELQEYGMITGGSVCYALNEFVPQESVGDIDIFVNSVENADKVRDIILEHCDNITLKTPRGRPESNVISFVTDKFIIQIILTEIVNIHEVIDTFDLDYIQCGLFFNKLYITDRCKEAHKLRKVQYYNEAKFNNNHRLVKAAKKGFTVIIDELPVTNGVPDYVPVPSYDISAFNPETYRMNMSTSSTYIWKQFDYHKQITIRPDYNIDYIHNNRTIPKITSNNNMLYHDMRHLIKCKVINTIKHGAQTTIHTDHETFPILYTNQQFEYASDNTHIFIIKFRYIYDPTHECDEIKDNPNCNPITDPSHSICTNKCNKMVCPSHGNLCDTPNDVICGRYIKQFCTHCGKYILKLYTYIYNILDVNTDLVTIPEYIIKI